MEYLLCCALRSSIVYAEKCSLNSFNSAIVCVTEVGSEIEANVKAFSSFRHVQHRRIDIYVVPYSEFPLALLHFTGSGHFNRSMRHKADKLVTYTFSVCHPHLPVVNMLYVHIQYHIVVRLCFMLVS